MLITNQPKKDLGKIKFGQPHSFTYEVTNTGDAPLEISKIVVGCNSCTKASTSKTKLKPEEASTINVTFTPGSIGSQKKFLVVKWNETQRLELSFIAESYE